MLHTKVEAIVVVDEEVGAGTLAQDCKVALSSVIFNYTCLPNGFAAVN